MSSKLIIDNEYYRNWINEVSRRLRQSQIKAAVKVNDEMLRFYWSLGRDMETIKDTYSWGSHFYTQVSKDLKRALPEAKSFSPRNLLYMHQFYRLFPDAEITPQVGAQLDKWSLFNIPWGHQKLLIDKCKGDSDRALFYIHKTLENNWSRTMLMNMLDTDLYERQGKAVTNFSQTLPAPQSDLAQAITRDPYNFDFLTILGKYDEKELKDALIDKVEKFLMELGTGFAFMGREVRIEIGKKEKYLDNVSKLTFSKC